MKTFFKIALFFCMLVSAYGQSQNVTATPGTGILIAPSTFFTGNGAAMLSAESGKATAAFSWNGQRLTNLADPSSAQDAATKAWTTANFQGVIPNLPTFTSSTITLGNGVVLTGTTSGTITVQGNTFNGASQLVQTTSGGLLPVLSAINLMNINASNIASGSLNDARLSANVTLQGNTFNGNLQLVQTTSGGILPILDGSNLTNVHAATFTGALSGDVTGTQSATVVQRINGTSLAGLATGILKNTTATGVPSIAVAGTDYLTPTGDGSGLTNLNASALSSGTVSAARMPAFSGDITTSSGSTSATVTKINGTALSGLSTGILKNTTATGVPSIAISGTDYAPATSGSSILYGNGVGGFSSVTVSTGLTFTPSSGVLAATGGGTVTSVAQTVPTGFAVSGSPVTGSGTLAITYSGQIPATSMPAFTGDITTTAGGTSATVTKINATSLAGLATGLLKNTTATGVPSIAVSGTDYAPATSGSSILYGNGSGAFSNVTISSGLTFSGGVLSATATSGFANPMTTLGDTIYGGASGTATRLAGVTTSSATGVFISTATSTGAAQVPAWSLAPTFTGTNLTALNASNITTGTLTNGVLSASVTLQGNTFNGNSQLVQTTSAGALPALSGANLTSLNASNISSGTLADGRLSSNVPLKNAANIFTAEQSIGGSANGIQFLADDLTTSIMGMNGSTIYCFQNAFSFDGGSGNTHNLDFPNWTAVTFTNGVGAVYVPTVSPSSDSSQKVASTAFVQNVLTANTVKKLTITFTPTSTGWYRLCQRDPNLWGINCVVRTAESDGGQNTQIMGGTNGYSPTTGLLQVEHTNNVVVVDQGRLNTDPSLNSRIFFDLHVTTTGVSTSVDFYDLDSSITTFSSPSQPSGSGESTLYSLTFNSADLINTTSNIAGANFVQTTFSNGVVYADSAGKFSSVTLSGGLTLSGGVLTQGASLTNPMTTLGDIIYGDTGGTAARLAGLTTSGATGILRSTATGTGAATAPVWDVAPTFTGTNITALNGSNLASGTVAAARMPAFSGDITTTAGGTAATVTKINGTALSGLATGIIKNTTSTGVPSIAAAGTDYAAATSGSAILAGNGAGGFSNVTTTLGDVVYGGASGAGTRLAGYTTSGGTAVLVSTATASGAAQAPTWSASPGISITGTASGLSTVASAGFILGNNSTGSATGSYTAFGSFMNTLQGSTQGAIAYRGSTTWTGLGTGTSGFALLTQGASANPIWSPVIRSVVSQTFTSSGTYTPTAGMVYCEVFCIGGGGGGGGCVSAVTAAASGGGGAGGFSWSLLTAATVSSSQTVTIGASGAGGTSGPNNGSAGGNSSLGTLVIANGGSGGIGASSVRALGGVGGTAGTGTMTVAGDDGLPGGIAVGSGEGGRGGYCPYGHAGISPIAAGAGNAATGFGSGGSGAYEPTATVAVAGGAGAQGYILIVEYVR